MSVKKILLDANIILDVLLSDRVGKAASNKLLRACEDGEYDGFVAFHTLPICAHYYRKGHSAQETNEMIQYLTNFLFVPTVGMETVDQVWSYPTGDFEDGLQRAIAESIGVTHIITRNIRDFGDGPIPALTPEDFLGVQ